MGERIVYTGGTFDLFHTGHVNLLRQCRRIAGKKGRVIVGLNTDAFAGRYKKPPVMSYDERLAVLDACRYVDNVFPNIGEEALRPTLTLIEQELDVVPNFLVIGSDWASKDYYKQLQFTQQDFDCWGIQLIYVPYTQGVSTSDVVKRVVGGQDGWNQ